MVAVHQHGLLSPGPSEDRLTWPPLQARRTVSSAFWSKQPRVPAHIYQPGRGGHAGLHSHCKGGGPRCPCAVAPKRSDPKSRQEGCRWEGVTGSTAPSGSWDIRDVWDGSKTCRCRHHSLHQTTGSGCTVGPALWNRLGPFCSPCVSRAEREAPSIPKCFFCT